MAERRILLRQPIGQPRQIELHSRQRLPQLIVQFARDFYPFFFTHHFQIGRQGAQVFIRLLQLGFGRQAIPIGQGVLDGNGCGRRERHEHVLIDNGEALAILLVADVKIAQHLAKRTQDRRADNRADISIDGELVLHHWIGGRIAGAVGDFMLQDPTRNTDARRPRMLKRNDCALLKILVDGHTGRGPQSRKPAFAVDNLDGFLRQIVQNGL